MRTKFKDVNGIDWFSGALMNGIWRGPLLRDVLLKAGVAIEGEAHAVFSCIQTECEDDSYYGASIELERVMDHDKFVILGLEVPSFPFCGNSSRHHVTIANCFALLKLNGKPLSIHHGFPVRVIIPGVAGARWVKWLDRVTVQRCESNNYYQKQDYKILPPHVETAEQAMANWHLYPAMQLMPINSVIAIPASSSVIVPDFEGKVTVAGYAVPHGDDGPVSKVEISLNRGKTWEETEIVLENPTRWSWAIWRTRIDVKRLIEDDPNSKEKSKCIWSRCWDKGGNVQDGKCQWNWRGVGYNGFGESKNMIIRLLDHTVDSAQELVNGVKHMKLSSPQSVSS